MATRESTSDNNSQNSSSGAGTGDGRESTPFLATHAADIFAGAEGADWVSYASSTRGIYVVLLDDSPAVVDRGWAAYDRLTGIDNLIGSDHNDDLIGNSAANILRGGAGRDYLVGGAGADILDGGQGSEDAALYHLASAGVRVDLSRIGAQQDFDGTHRFFGNGNGNEAVGDILIGIEDLWGSKHADWLTGDDGDNRIHGNDGRDLLEGGAGRDILHGGAGTDTVSYSSSSRGVRVDLSLTGAQQDFGRNSYGFAANNNDAVGDTLISIERVVGSEYADWLTGDGGHNELFGYGGNDRLEGGAGDDTLYGGAGDDTLYGGAGEDNLYGGAGDDTLFGGAGVIDNLYGGAGDDTLFGGAGLIDILYGGAGDDTLYGGAGAGGYLAGDAGDDTLYGGAGAYILDGGVGDDRLEGGAGRDTLDGGEGNDTIDGGAGDDTLKGGDGSDTLDGGEGNDYLYGGVGDDTLYGGAGTDTYVFTARDGTDTIVDEAGDTMTLRFSRYSNFHYEAADFVEASDNFNRVGNNLEITIDKYPEDGVTDKITIENAYDSDPETGTGNAAFTINIEYGRGISTEVTNDFWHTL